MEKDADAYRTISEVSESLDIPPHVLRFWESKFPQVRPLKRGGGRRYYRRADTDLLRSIRRLLYDEGYTIRGVQRLLKVQGPASVVRLAEPAASVPAEEALERAPDDLPITMRDPMRPVDPHDLPAVLAFLAAEVKACRAILDEAARTAA